MSIVGKIFMIIFSVALGIGQGYQPVVGYNYSSKHFDRVKKAFLFTFISCTIVMSVMGIIFFIFSNNVIKLFMDPKENDVEKVIEIGGQALRYQCLAMPLLGVNLICNMSFQATRKKTLATILSICRQGFFFIPLVLILPSIISLKGVQLTQPLSDVLSCLFSIPFFIYFIRHLNKKESENL
jgi:Na+-driven multidrug efflux pump